MTSLTVVLPLPPNMANSRMHWRTKHNAQHHYRDQCDTLLLLRKVTKPLWSEAGHRAALAFRMYVGGRMDHDGALSRMKWPVDWLVRNGYLVDDAPKYCSMSIPEQVITRDKSQQRVEITITYEDPEEGMVLTDLQDYGVK